MAALSFLTKTNPRTIGIASISLIIVASLIGFYLMPKFIHDQLIGMNLKSGSDQRKLWERTPFPLTFKLYVFNVSNPLEVVQGKKPILQQIGPFVFEEWKSKNVLSEDEDEDSVTFEMINTYKFRPDLTIGFTGEEVVTVPHLMLMGALIATQRDRAPLLGIVINAFTQIFKPEGTPFLTAKVMDIFFRGIGIDCNNEGMEASVICGQLGGEKGIKKKNETFFTVSVFGSKNATSLGKFKVNRGVKNILKVGEVITFEDNEESTAYSGECNKIIGTDGTIFAPFHKNKDTLYSFSPAFCRSLGPEYRTEASYNSVPTSVYTLNFGDIKGNKSQHCFCRGQDPLKCPPKGTLDVYPCVGIPFVISKPHFLEADRKLLKDVQGLKPIKRDHDSVLQFEMMTGSPISVYNRIQFNLQVEPIPEFDLMANMEEMLLPFFWIEESINLDKKITNMMRYGLYLSQTVVAIFKFCGILIGLIGLIYTGYRMIQGNSERKTSVQPPPQIENPISARSLQGVIDAKY